MEKSPLPQKKKKKKKKKNLLRGGSNPRHSVKQDSEPNTPPTSYFDPWSDAVPQKQATSNLKLPKKDKNKNKKKADWDSFREAVYRKTAPLELPATNINNSVALLNKAVPEAAKMFIPRGRRQDYQPYGTTQLDNPIRLSAKQERRWKARQQTQM